MILYTAWIWDMAYEDSRMLIGIFSSELLARTALDIAIDKAKEHHPEEENIENRYSFGVGEMRLDTFCEYELDGLLY